MPQNVKMRYYRGVVVEAVAKSKKMDRSQAHEYLKKRFFGKSTTEFPDDEFDAKLSEIRQAMSEEGIWIPMPNEDPIPPNEPPADERQDIRA